MAGNASTANQNKRMITKRQLQERVALMHKQIEWCTRASNEELKATIQEKWSGIQVGNETRDEMLRVIFKGLVSELFHPGL
jgi:hypothetical protein